MNIKQEELEKIILDIKYAGGLVKIIQDYCSKYNEINLIERLEDDLEILNKIRNGELKNND